MFSLMVDIMITAPAGGITNTNTNTNTNNNANTNTNMNTNRRRRRSALLQDELLEDPELETLLQNLESAEHCSTQACRHEVVQDDILQVITYFIHFPTFICSCVPAGAGGAGAGDAG